MAQYFASQPRESETMPLFLMCLSIIALKLGWMYARVLWARRPKAQFERDLEYNSINKKPLKPMLDQDVWGHIIESRATKRAIWRYVNSVASVINLHSEWITGLAYGRSNREIGNLMDNFEEVHNNLESIISSRMIVDAFAGRSVEDSTLRKMAVDAICEEIESATVKVDSIRTKILKAIKDENEFLMEENSSKLKKFVEDRNSSRDADKIELHNNLETVEDYSDEDSAEQSKYHVIAW